MMNRYRPMLRPAGFATLPPGVRWEYVQSPAMSGLCNRPDLPRSDYRYGVISTDRALTVDEINHFDLVPV